MQLTIGRLALVFAAVLVAVGAVAPSDPRVLNTHGGSWQGVTKDGFIGFYGIKFGNADRFKAPVAVKQTEHTLNTDWGSVCSQFATTGEEGTEDCLFLNVFVPIRESKELLPVAVNIHPGTFVRGSGAHAQFPFESFARAGIVTVTINYRLGMFGFMSLPQLMEEAPLAPSNFGLLDQRMALEWVQDNIGLFGGDPARVTAMGESAGAASILHQMVYKNGTGNPLFERAFLSSPPALSGPEYTVQNLTKGYLLAASRLGCDPAVTADVLACMRALPQSKMDISKNRTEVFPYSTSCPAEYLFAGWPSNDGVNFPDVGVALAEGRFWKDVTVMIGSDWDEGLSFLTLITPVFYPSETFLPHQLQEVYGVEEGKKLWEVYKPGPKSTRKNVGDSFADIVGDTILNCPTWIHTHSLARHSNKPVFRYSNNHVFKNSIQMFGSFHTCASALFFNNTNASFPFPSLFSPDEQAGADILYKVMLDFIQGQNPDHKFWPPFKNDEELSLHLTVGNLTLAVEAHWKSDTCAPWGKLFPPYGLWAPACRKDIWADEPLVAHITNSFVWWIFLHLKTSAYIAGAIGIATLALVVRCCCCWKCCCSSSNRSATKVKKD